MGLSDLWEGFAATVKEGVGELARNTVGDFIPQAQADATAFLNASGEKLRKWGDLLANGQISADEFEFLLGSQRDLAKMHALTALGLTATRLERFRTGLISLIVKSAFGVIGIGGPV